MRRWWKVLLFGGVSLYLYSWGGIYWTERRCGWVVFTFLAATWWLHLTVEAWGKAKRND